MDEGAPLVLPVATARFPLHVLNANAMVPQELQGPDVRGLEGVEGLAPVLVDWPLGP